MGGNMEIKLRNNVLTLKKRIKSDETYKISKTGKFESISFYKKPIQCLGYSSKTSDNKHILLVDYDNVEYSVVQEDILSLQKSNNLPTAYVFCTNFQKLNGEIIGNFHVIFLSKHSMGDILEMLRSTSADINFIDSPIRNKYRTWVLRFNSKYEKRKPFYYATFLNNSYVYDISTAHKKLLSKLYPQIKHPKYTNEDYSQKIKFQVYETSR
jgi:hypothetical protein